MLPVSLALTLAFLGCGCFGCFFFSFFFGDSSPRKGTGVALTRSRCTAHATELMPGIARMKKSRPFEDLCRKRKGSKSGPSWNQSCSFWRIRFWAAYAQIFRGLVAKEHLQLSGRHHNAIYNFQLENKIVLHMQLPQQGTLTQPLCCDLQAMSCKTQ